MKYFFINCSKNSVVEMLTSIIYDCSRHMKMSKYSVSHPLGHIVHNNQNVQIAKGVQKRSHEINAPNVKNLNYQNGIEGNHIPPRNTP
jgi:hypothetical protein